MVSVIWHHDWCDMHVDVKTFEDLQCLYQHAIFACPSTFHGTVFSIIHHKSFYSMNSRMRGKKVEYLLKELGLEERLYTCGKCNFDEITNWDLIDDRIQYLRKNSINYLNEALNCVEHMKEK